MVQKTPSWYFLNNSVKNEPILITFGYLVVHRIMKKFGTSDYAFVHHTWKNCQPHCLVKCRTRSPDRSYIVSPKKWMTLKTTGYYAVQQLEFQRNNMTTLIGFRSRTHAGWPHYLGTDEHIKISSSTQSNATPVVLHVGACSMTSRPNMYRQA